MNEVLSQLVLLIPVFLASPTMYAVMIVVLGSEVRPARRATAMLIGSAVTVVIIGLIALAVGGATGGGPEREPSTLSGIIYLGLGALLIFVGVRAAFRKPEPEAEARESPKPPAAEPSFIKDVGLGFLVTITNPTSLASYIAIAKTATDSGISTTQQLIVMGIAGFFFVAPVLWPLVVSVVAPSVSDRFLAAVNRALKKYGRWVVVVLCAWVGVNLLRKGIDILS